MKRRSAAVFSAIVATIAAIGCQLIVSSDIAEVACASSDPSACPSGMTCDEANQRCVALGSVPEGGDGANEGGRDAGSDQDVAPGSLGAPCRVDIDCDSRICGASTIVTNIITQESGPICTQTCCTSNDCPLGFVCFGASTGGNYCVAADKAQRTPPTAGGRPPGEACDTNDKCRSGYCRDGLCLDTCCAPGDCTGGTVCRVTSVAVPGPSRDIWACAPVGDGGTKEAGATCGNTFECINDNCAGFIPKKCLPPCCNANSCAAQGFPGGRCQYGKSGQDYLKWCFIESEDGGAAPLGSSCLIATDCKSMYCDPELKKCAETCCMDTDCPTGQTCRPSASTTPFLRCAK